MTDDLSASLRAAEQRIKELEAKVRQLEDRADRAERWVYKIWVEIEQKFFGGDAVLFLGNYILRFPWPVSAMEKSA